MGSRKIIDRMGLVAVDGESHSQPRTAGPTCSRLDRCRVSAVLVRHATAHTPHRAQRPVWRTAVSTTEGSSSIMHGFSMKPRQDSSRDPPLYSSKVLSIRLCAARYVAGHRWRLMLQACAASSRRTAAQIPAIGGSRVPRPGLPRLRPRSRRSSRDSRAPPALPPG